MRNAEARQARRDQPACRPIGRISGVLMTMIGLTWPALALFAVMLDG